MLDLETMGQGTNAAIVAIGAVKFELETGMIGAKFYKVVDLHSCVEIGLEIDASTVIWWLGQNKGAKDLIINGAVHIKEALEEFTQFYRDNDKGFVWGNGSTFDNIIMENAYKKAGMNPPWHYTLHRDVRTVVDIAKRLGIAAHSKIVIGTAHSAVDDAIHQANFVMNYFTMMKNL